jgi:hypothetical protein
MKREKTVKSPKVLKSFKNMRFVERRIVVGTGEIRDYFFHEIGQITLRRNLHYWSNGETYVNWTCDELGGGNAGISYWLLKAKDAQRFRKCSKGVCHQ